MTLNTNFSLSTNVNLESSDEPGKMIDVETDQQNDSGE
jgi:hypothetical protein